MNYKKINFEIVENTNGTKIGDRESGNKYLRFACINPTNMEEGAHNVVIFDQEIVKQYEQLLPERLGGKLPDEGWDENKMPIQTRVFTNGSCEPFEFGGQYVQKYSNDIIDSNGVVVHAKGDYVCYKGTNNPKITTSITVFCKYEFEMETVIDEFGMPVVDPKTFATKMRIIRDKDGMPIKHWCKGWSPEDIGSRMRENFYIPYEQYARENGAPTKSTLDEVTETIPETKDMSDDDA